MQTSCQLLCNRFSGGHVLGNAPHLPAHLTICTPSLRTRRSSFGLRTRCKLSSTTTLASHALALTASRMRYRCCHALSSVCWQASSAAWLSRSPPGQPEKQLAVQADLFRQQPHA
jgi:hypothetical protein